MNNTTTKMTFPEIADYSGFIYRKPTEEEIDRVLEFIVSGEMEGRLSKGEPVPLEKLTEVALGIKEEYKNCILSTGYVMDLPMVGKTVFYFHLLRIKLLDHNQSLPAVFGDNEKLKRIVVDAFRAAGSPAASPHNHITITYFALRTDSDSIKFLSHSENDICLSTTK